MTDLTTLSRDQLLALVASMQTAAQAKVTLKVGEKGTVCLYHGARYPIALYAEQWERIIPFIKAGHLDKFIEANADKLTRREDAKA